MVSTKYYCDICGEEMDFPRFIYIKRKVFSIDIWGNKYDDVCANCVKSVADHIRNIRREHANTDKKD